MKFIIYYSVFEEWRWKLVDEDGMEIALSRKGYFEYTQCLNEVRNVRKYAVSATISEPENKPKGKGFKQLFGSK